VLCRVSFPQFRPIFPKKAVILLTQAEHHFRACSSVCRRCGKQPDGKSTLGPNEQQIETVIAHPIFTSSTSWLGGHPGVDAFLPVIHVRNDFAGGGSGSETGLGDTAIGPYLQWPDTDPVTGSYTAITLASPAIASYRWDVVEGASLLQSGHPAITYPMRRFASCALRRLARLGTVPCYSGKQD
jgi:hypothetical protein